MKYELKAYATTNDGYITINFYENAEPSNDLYVRYFHVELKDKYHTHDFDAHFNTYNHAEKLFKEMIKEYEIQKVYISDEYLKWLTAEPNYDETPTQEEEYAEACMAEACGEPMLMERYNRKYGIEKEYGPSNPWDAPGMSVRDFI